MSKAFILSIVLSINYLGYSQDIIYKISNNDSILAKVIEINMDNIKYRKHSNLDGPLYTIDKTQLDKIVFNNGEIENFSFNKEKKIDIEEVKNIIIETINAYGYSYYIGKSFSSGKKYIAEFEDNYLKLTLEGIDNSRITVSSYYYDFTAECNFHELSARENGISIVNVGMPFFYKRKDGGMKKGKYQRSWDSKLIMKVIGWENGKILRDALIQYNEYFK